ncbi:MAG: hypothetical protein Q9215_004622 [Flavoplaca cf. flavocitrina]
MPSPETSDERFAAHLNCLGTLSAVRNCYAREDLELPDSIIETIKAECQKLSYMLREYSILDLFNPDTKKKLEDLKDILEALEDTSGDDAQNHHFEFSEIKERIAGWESLLRLQQKRMTFLKKLYLGILSLAWVDWQQSLLGKGRLKFLAVHGFVLFRNSLAV